VEALIKLGANVNAADYKGWTPLHLATSTGKLAVVKILNQREANLNQVSHLGYSALHIAVAQQKEDVVDLLAAKLGAQVNVSATDGETPLRILPFAKYCLSIYIS
jgi:ankyrin repeat protein